MSVKNGKDYLYLIWKCELNRRNYIVGQLSKNSHFEFQYCEEINTAIENGFTLLVSFENIDEVYKCKELFPVFASRLPDRKRKDIKKILNKYGLEEYDSYNLLKRSGARLPIDNLQFIDPILDFECEFEKTFYLVGIRHYLKCKGNSCIEDIEVNIGDRVFLEAEKDNSYDEYAVRIVNINKDKIGYVPRYYSYAFSRFIEEKRIRESYIVNVDKDNCCDECIGINVKISGL